MNTQTCETCKKELQVSAFDKSDDSYRRKCKKCRYERTKEIRQERAMKNINKLKFKKEKKCSICSKVKEVDEFNFRASSKDGIASVCRECYNKNRPSNTKHQALLNTFQTKQCNTCFVNKSVENFKKTAKSADGYFHRCNACWKPREWNKEKQKESEKKYCDKNKEKLKLKWQRDGQKLTRKLKSRLSNRIKDALLASSLRKDNKTMSYIGCSHAELRRWFEFLFVEGMSWDNFGQWHIDHVIPCISFDLTKQSDIDRCFNWKNIRPCWAKDNLEKGSLTIPEVVNDHMTKVNQFLNNPLPSHPGDRDDGQQ